MTYQPPQGYPQQYVPHPSNGFAITALVLGLVGMLFGLIPLTGFIAVVLGVIGLVFGLCNIGRLRSRHSNATVMTWFGVVASLIALVLGGWGTFLMFQSAGKVGAAFEDFDTVFDNQDDALDSPRKSPRPNSDVSPRPAPRKPKPQPPGVGATYSGDIFEVTVLDTMPSDAEVRFCATGEYKGGPIPISRRPWSIVDVDGNTYAASQADSRHVLGPAFPLETTVDVGTCVQGWLAFDSPLPLDQIVYDSDLGQTRWAP